MSSKPASGFSLWESLGQELRVASAVPAVPRRSYDLPVPKPGSLQHSDKRYPAGSTAIQEPQKERREGPLSSGAPPVLGSAFLWAQLVLCRAAAIFQTPDWQPGAVSILFPPRPNLKDGFNIYLLARELQAGSGRARLPNPAPGPKEAHPPPRHRAVPLNE